MKMQRALNWLVEAVLSSLAGAGHWRGPRWGEPRLGSIGVYAIDFFSQIAQFLFIARFLLPDSFALTPAVLVVLFVLDLVTAYDWYGTLCCVLRLKW